MTRQTLAEALTLTNDGAGGLTARLDPGFSNAPQAMDPGKGAPFGGLMAALAAGAARQGLDIATPLQTLSIQYLAAARFEDVTFRPTMTRGGRNVAYAHVLGGQDDRPAVQALATFGRDVDGPKLFGQNAGGSPELGCWMRCVDAAPLDELRLLFLLDGLYPTYFTAFPAPPAISTSVDLRADLLTELTPQTSPEGWAYFHFWSRDVGGGWAVEDGAAWAPDGRPLAVVRQRRKILPARA